MTGDILRLTREGLSWIGRVEVDGLDLALQLLFLGQAGHHGQRIAQDHPVRPVGVVLVEIDLLVEVVVEAVEVGEEGELIAESATLTPTLSLGERGGGEGFR